MSRGSEKDSRRHRPWLLPVVGVVAALVGTACLGYLAFAYVPSHALRLAEAGAELPLSTRLALLTSNWFVRLLPFAVITGLLLVLPLLAIVIGVALARGAPGWLWAAFGIVFLAVALGEAVLCGIMVYGIHAALASLGG